jgi:predicted transposase/invertase (TIGR01784 family)
VCDLHSNQKGVGIPYRKLARTYQITFCGYTVFENRENCFNRFSFRNEEGEELLDTVNILFVELSKLARVLEKPVDKMTGAEMWAIFLAYANKPKYRETLRKIIEAKEEIKVAYELLTSISQDPDERAQFRARRKFQMDLQHNLITVFDEGKQEGIREGELKGKLEGIREGELKGELKGKLEVARNLLANRVPLDVVVQSTGLSLDKIQSLIG